MHTAGSSKQRFFPWGGAALNRAKCPTRTMASSRALQREAERTDMVVQKKKKKKSTAETPESKSLIRYSSSAFCRLHLYENLLGWSLLQAAAAPSDSDQDGMWGCKFLLHLSPGCGFNRFYTLQSELWFSVIIPHHISSPSFLYGSYLYATFGHSAAHVWLLAAKSWFARRLTFAAEWRWAGSVCCPGCLSVGAKYGLNAWWGLCAVHCCEHWCHCESVASGVKVGGFLLISGDDPGFWPAALKSLLGSCLVYRRNGHCSRGAL